MTDGAPFYVARRELTADPDQVWSVISDFGGLSRWSEAITACSADGNEAGALRTVMVGEAEIRERLEAIDHTARFLRYRPISGSSLPFEGFFATMQLAALDDGRTAIAWSVFGTPTIEPDKARDMLAKRYAFRLNELEACLDRGAA
ncbi:SRPBCC family protein [Novosphingobium cyanobacteriorum]|uniref:SRPBCC family protein n=1 Tax=Novosphingobium cyanobacteriorum TaxID=3024215 RepID=A0ABT6CMB3_9SPHN|nr:SRPBCC family protein [Novosphingobium cyanobacteriorum]MDF8334669.1 SRPBCC family protein [Novosphingobium cyanobacteriorum]